MVRPIRTITCSPQPPPVLLIGEQKWTKICITHLPVLGGIYGLIKLSQLEKKSRFLTGQNLQAILQVIMQFQKCVTINAGFYGLMSYCLAYQSEDFWFLGVGFVETFICGLCLGGLATTEERIQLIAKKQFA